MNGRWAIVDVRPDRAYAGWVEEIELLGAPALLVEVPETTETTEERDAVQDRVRACTVRCPAYSVELRRDAVIAVTPCAEADVRRGPPDGCHHGPSPSEVTHGPWLTAADLARLHTPPPDDDLPF